MPKEIAGHGSNIGEKNYYHRPLVVTRSACRGVLKETPRSVFVDLVKRPTPYLL